VLLVLLWESNGLFMVDARGVAWSAGPPIAPNEGEGEIVGDVELSRVDEPELADGHNCYMV
jgi:hypothetical protein